MRLSLTRQERFEAGLVSERVRPWARHGSTIYLGKERDVEKAVEYVLLGQDGELP